MLFRNVSYTIVATLVIFYSSTYLSEISYLLLIAFVTNLVVLIDCYGVMQLQSCLLNYKELKTVNPELY
jgi:hypothetical protein